MRSYGAMIAVALASMGLISCEQVLDLPSDITQDPHLVCGEGGCACEDGFARCGGAGAACATDVRSSAEHCGACGNSCGGGSCVFGLCTPKRLAGVRGVGIAWFGAGDPIVAARAFDYHDMSSPSELALVSREGGIIGGIDAPKSLNGVDGFVGGPLSIIHGGGDVYVLSTNVGELDNVIYAVEGGGDATTVLCDRTDARELVGVTEKFAYFSAKEGAQRCRAPRGVRSTSDECVGDLSPAVPLRATAAGDRSYWASGDGGISVWTDDGLITPLLAGEPGATIQALSVSGEELYLLETFSQCPGEPQTACDRVSAIPVLGGARRVLSTTPVSGPPPFPPSMVVDGTYVYLFDGRSEGALLRAPIEGGYAERIGAHMFAVGRALSDDDALYFTDDSAVYRITKPTKGRGP